MEFTIRARITHAPFFFLSHTQPQPPHSLFAQSDGDAIPQIPSSA
jgi:hypothetical protein